MLLRSSFLLFFFSLWIPAFSSWANEGSHFHGPEISVEGNSPEVCFVYDVPLHHVERDVLAQSIRLRHRGRIKPVTSHHVFWDEYSFCLQGLDYRQHYVARLPKMRLANGEEWTKEQDVSFSIPDRAQALGFVVSADSLAMPHYDVGYAPTLRSVNVPRARVKLFYFSGKEQIVKAWQKYRQTHLSPSESLVYARDAGEMVFESDLVFAGNLNHVQKLETPLPPKDKLKKGLYYLSALPEQDEKDLSLFAGQWFLISDLRVHAAFVDGNTLSVSASKPDVTFQILSDTGTVLAEVKNAKANEKQTLSFDLKNAEILYAVTPEGDMALLDVKPLPSTTSGKFEKVSQDNQGISLKTDRAAIGVDGQVNVTLKAKSYTQGRLVLKPVRRENEKWPYYRFGVPVEEEKEITKIIPFMVGPEGRVVLPIKIEAGAAGRELNALSLSTFIDHKKANHMFVPVSLGRSSIGIRQMPSESFLPGSQQVHFDVIAIGEDGKRIGKNDLFYRFIQEGRDFKWAAHEGVWHYKRLPRYRRVEGGSLQLSASDDNRLSRLLTPGMYQLQITDSRERPVAQYAFSVRNWRVETPAKTTRKDMNSKELTSKPFISLPWTKAKASYAIDKDEPFDADRGLEISRTSFLFSPIKTPDFLPLLTRFIEAEPQSVLEIARWLEASDPWLHHAVSLGMIDADYAARLREARLQQIQMRQRPDGGFAAFDHHKSDVVSTAAALRVLSYHKKIENEAAVLWLKKKLHDNWLEENKWPDFSYAYWILASIQQVDVDSLNYFAQQVREDKLSSETAAYVSAALLLVGEKEKAAKWVQKAISGDVSLDAALTLSFHDDVSQETLLKLLNHYDLKAQEDRVDQAVAFLSFLTRVALRAESWHLEINGQDQKIFGFYASSLGKEKTLFKHHAAEAIHYITLKKVSPLLPRQKLSIVRKLYDLEGTLLSAEKRLQAGKDYLLWMEFTAKEEGALRFVMPKALSYSLVVPESEDMLPRFFPWLAARPSPLKRLIETARGYGFTIEGKDRSPIVLLLRAHKSISAKDILMPVVQQADSGLVQVQ